MWRHFKMCNLTLGNPFCRYARKMSENTMGLLAKSIVSRH